MDAHPLSPRQKEIIHLPLEGKFFIEGPAGSGKTTATIARINHIFSHYTGHQMLLFVPQRSLAKPYFDHFHQQREYSGSLPVILTFGGFARRMVDLFWPVIAGSTHFSNSRSRPYFLNMESAQYCMEKVAQPLLEKGFFQSVVIEKSRLFGQVLDNLNKAAVVRFPLTEIAQRLKSINHLDASMEIAYDQVQICAMAFRAFCYEYNVMDYSLLIDLFMSTLYHSDEFIHFFRSRYPVIIADNIEEDVPVLHDFIRENLPAADSAWLVFDQNSGFRSFLGADPQSAHDLKESCEQSLVLDEPFINKTDILALNQGLSRCIIHEKIERGAAHYGQSVNFLDFQFYPEMVKSVCLQVQELVESRQAEPGDIVILAPYLSDALNFSLQTYMDQFRIPTFDYRPSRKYLDDPAVRSMISLAKLAHPQWEMSLSRYELRDTLLCCFKDMDIIRADLIARTLFNPTLKDGELRAFDTITNRVTQERITFYHGENLELLRGWLGDYQSKDPQPLDVFISRIYGEVLSQSNFRFFEDFASANSIARLITSIKNFRYFSTAFLDEDEIFCGAEYIRSIQTGLLPSAFFDPREEPSDAVFIAPAHSFLMQNRRVAYQFWLDIGSLGWWERLNQPLTNPYLLNRSWDGSQQWTIAHEYAANKATMLKIVQGLLNRCTRQVTVCSVSINEQGTEQRGPLLRAFQSLQKQVLQFRGDNHV
jgi:hypothetical protein